MPRSSAAIAARIAAPVAPGARTGNLTPRPRVIYVDPVAL